MWELICHHTYKWQGVATDLSLYDSHGNAENLSSADFLEDGATPGSGAWRFHLNSRVAIATNPGWSPLVGLRVEAVIRMPVLASHRQIVDRSAQELPALHPWIVICSRAFHGNPAVYPQQDWDIVSTYKDGLQFPGYRVPLNKWIHVLFEHDGLTQMRLSVDGVAVTSPRGVLSGVPGVGPKGICIGNSVVDGDNRFQVTSMRSRCGASIPRAVRKQFLGPPIDQATADCWASHVRSLTAAFAKYPDCAKKLTAEMRAALDRWLRAIVAQGPETRQRFEEVREEYAKLWREGKLDGPEMRKLLGDWCAWLRLVGIDPCGDEQARAIKQSECWRLVPSELAGWTVIHRRSP